MNRNSYEFQNKYIRLRTDCHYIQKTKDKPFQLFLWHHGYIAIRHHAIIGREALQRLSVIIDARELIKYVTHQSFVNEVECVVPIARIAVTIVTIRHFVLLLLRFAGTDWSCQAPIVRSLVSIGL